MGKKGQVTVFIILGILLLAVFALFLYFSNTTTILEVETEGRPVAESVPLEFLPIQQFVESCMYSVGKKGIVLLGQQGGYISPESLGEFSLNDQTDSIGINLDPLKVPYWHYNQNPNGESSVSMVSLQPALYDEDDEYWSVESQLSRYIDENLESCLNSFSVFEAQSFVFDYDPSYKQTTTRIWDNYLDFVLEMPVAATLGESTTEMETFYTDLEINFKEIYDFASIVSSSQQEKKFLETQILDLLLIHSGEDPKLFAPFNGVTFDSTISWEASILKDKLREVLLSYVPSLRHTGSSNYFYYEFDGTNLPEGSALTSLTQRVSNNMILPIEGDNTLEIRFDYFNWEPYFSMNGDSESISTIDYSFESPFDYLDFDIEYQQIYTTYDVSYPVLVTVTDPTALNGEGYTLNFALEANIINNEPFEESYSANPVVISKSDSLACNDNQRDTEAITIHLVDAFTHEPLELVDISFSLPGFDKCLIGQTDNQGKLTASYPSVYGGEIELINPDYLRTSLTANTYIFSDQQGIIGYAVSGLSSPVIELYPKKEIDVTVMKKELGKCIVPTVCNLDKEKCDEYANRQCFFNDGSTLFLSEQADYSYEVEGSMTYLNEYYFLDSTKETSSTDPQSASVILELVEPINDIGLMHEDFKVILDFTSSETQTVELVPGIYALDAQIVTHLDSELQILSDLRCDGAEKDKHCFEMGGSTLTEIVSLTSFDTEETYITITEEDLYNSNNLNLFLLDLNFKYATGTVTSYDESGSDVEVNRLLLEDLSLMTETAEISKQATIRAALEPNWS